LTQCVTADIIVFKVGVIMDYSIEIKKLRSDMGMNRKEFCEYYNIPYRTVTDWEAGKRKMPEYVFRLIEYKAKVEQHLK